MDVAVLFHRASGTYPGPEDCLVCETPVDPEGPHIFVRDPTDTLGDDQAMVGLLHDECEDLYIREAREKGLSVRTPGR